MANLPVTITVTTAAPVSSRDLPKLDRIITAAMQSAGGKVHHHGSTLIDGDYVITCTVTAR
jgi:hypothetical protein